jgi:hypothetical protein
LYEKKRMLEKGIVTYEKFLKIWRKADPVYKEPGDARKRLARLKNMSRDQGSGIVNYSHSIADIWALVPDP